MEGPAARTRSGLAPVARLSWPTTTAPRAGVHAELEDVRPGVVPRRVQIQVRAGARPRVEVRDEQCRLVVHGPRARLAERSDDAASAANHDRSRIVAIRRVVVLRIVGPRRELASREHVAAPLQGHVSHRGDPDLAIVDGPHGSLVIPAWQLFPASTVRGGGDGAVIGFDRRFQGEETLAAAIRSLRLGVMPRVVVVHAEDRTMLRPTQDGLEVSGIVDALRTARFEVVEWMPGRTERPIEAPGRPTVWFVTPPLQRSGLEYTDSERSLIDATRALLAEGAPV